MDITVIIIRAIELISSICLIVVIPSIKALVTSKVDAVKLERAYEIIKIVVAAADQLFPREMAEEKLAYAVEHARESLEKVGVEFNAMELRNIIEAEVLRLHKAITE